jgi:hypothetical protein
MSYYEKLKLGSFCHIDDLTSWRADCLRSEGPRSRSEKILLRARGEPQRETASERSPIPDQPAATLDHRITNRHVFRLGLTRIARTALGCSDLRAVKIAPAHPPGSGPNWDVKEFDPPLPPMAEKEARDRLRRLSGRYALKTRL